jgi:hypothetical protein
MVALRVNWAYFIQLGISLMKNLDQGWAERMGAQGVYSVLSIYSSAIDVSSY